MAGPPHSFVATLKKAPLNYTKVSFPKRADYDIVVFIFTGLRRSEMQSHAACNLIFGPWKAQMKEETDELQQSSKGIFEDRKVVSSELAHRLFDESELRLARSQHLKRDANLSKVANSDIFINRTVLMFAAPSSRNGQVVSWLENIFDLYVLNAQSPTFFYEWLFRYAHVADLMIIDRDTFKNDKPSFNRFVRLAREACETLPIIVVSEEFSLDDFSFRWSDDWDISLRTPVSQTSLCHAVGVACEISLYGR